MRNSTLGDVSLWLLRTMNYKVSHSPLRSPAKDRVQLSLALRQHGTWTAQLYQAIAYDQQRIRIIQPMCKEPWDVCQLCASQTGPWPTAESLDSSRKLAFTYCFQAALWASEKGLTLVWSPPGFPIREFWSSLTGHTAPPMGKVALAQGVAFHPHGMQDVFTEDILNAWPGSQLPPCPGLGWKELLGILCFEVS